MCGLAIFAVHSDLHVGTLVARRIGLGARPLQIKFLDPSLADPGLKESLEKVSQRINRAHYDGCITRGGVRRELARE